MSKCPILLLFRYLFVCDRYEKEMKAVNRRRFNGRTITSSAQRVGLTRFTIPQPINVSLSLSG